MYGIEHPGAKCALQTRVLLDTFILWAQASYYLYVSNITVRSTTGRLSDTAIFYTSSGNLPLNHFLRKLTLVGIRWYFTSLEVAVELRLEHPGVQ